MYVGDRIVAINGYPADRMRLSYETERPTVSITFDRSGKRKTRTLRLRELLP
jgi:hypothetical protein